MAPIRDVDTNSVCSKSVILGLVGETRLYRGTIVVGLDHRALYHSEVSYSLA